MPKIKLGHTVRDRITGFQGCVTGITKWWSGCTTIQVKSREMKDGIPIDSQAFDIENLEYVDEGLAHKKEEKPVPTGGPDRSLASPT